MRGGGPKRKLHLLTPLVACLVLLTSTYFVWLRGLQLADSQLQTEFNYKVAETVSRIENLLHVYIELHSADHLHSFSNNHIEDLFQDTVTAKAGDLDIEIHDGAQPTPESILFDSDLRRRHFDSANKARYSHSQKIEMAGKTWSVHIHSLPAFEEKLDVRPAYFAGIVGIALSFTVAAALWIIATSRARALALVEEKTRELSEINQISRWIHSIDRVLSEATTHEQAIEAILKCLANETNWKVASYWSQDPESQQLRLIQMHASEPLRFRRFMQLTEAILLDRGEGFAEQAFLTKQATWMPNLKMDHSFYRLQAARESGLKSGFAIPIKSSTSIIGVIELFSEEIVNPSEAAAKELEAVGLRIGQRFENLGLAEELRMEQARLRQLTDAIDANAVVLRIDPLGKITFVNEKYCELTGYSAEEAIGKYHFFCNVGVESKSVLREISRTVTSGKTWTGEIRDRAKSGDILTFSSFIAPVIRADGTAENYIAVRFDVTAQKKSQEQLVEAQAIAKVGSWWFDLATQSSNWSKEHYRIFELPETLQGADLFNEYRARLHPDDMREMFHLVERAQKYGEDYVYEHRVLLDGGSRIKYVRGIGKVVRNESGNPSLIKGTCQDITEEIEMQKQLESERAKSLHNAKLASLGEMSAGIAHEINNPLAIIDGTLRTLKKFKDSSEKFDAKLETLMKSTLRISRIVNGLKKFARASDGSEYSPIQIARILDEVSVLTDAKARRNLIQITYDIKTQSQILCDSVEIEQVFINLLNNGMDAIKNSREKWLKVVAFDESGETIVRVIDSGSGIPFENEQKIFQPFFTTKRVGEGTGLGLSIAKGILDQHQATISVNHALENTCFEVRFKNVSEVPHAA